VKHSTQISYAICWITQEASTEAHVGIRKTNAGLGK